MSQIIERLSDDGLSEEVCRVIGECVSVRSDELKVQLLRDSSKVSPSSLTDFDWKLKVSSDSISPCIISQYLLHVYYTIVRTPS